MQKPHRCYQLSGILSEVNREAVLSGVENRSANPINSVDACSLDA